MVRCRNCGHENDMDAGFCESCGSNLKPTMSSRAYPKKKDGMAQSTKILIIVIVILVAALGIAGGVFLQDYLSNSNKNTPAVNQTNISTNSSHNNTTSNQISNKTTSSNSGFISPQQAITIAKSSIESDPSNVYSAQFVNGFPYGSPYYYAVSAKYKSGGAWFLEPTEVDVNAKTGKIEAKYQSGGTNDPLVPD